MRPAWTTDHRVQEKQQRSSLASAITSDTGCLFIVAHSLPTEQVSQHHPSKVEAALSGYKTFRQCLVHCLESRWQRTLPYSRWLISLLEPRSLFLRSRRLRSMYPWTLMQPRPSSLQPQMSTTSSYFLHLKDEVHMRPALVLHVQMWVQKQYSFLQY